MPCQFPGCKIPTPSDWCLRHGKVYGNTIKSKPQQQLSIPELMDRAQKEFNRFIRDRDRVYGCITCGGQVTDCGHYIPVGESSALRLTEDNAAGQCAKCNRMEYGERKKFRAALIKRIGRERVEALEDTPDFKKWSRLELTAIIEKYKQEKATI